jgi:hypothetical protein
LFGECSSRSSEADPDAMLQPCAVSISTLLAAAGGQQRRVVE